MLTTRSILFIKTNLKTGITLFITAFVTSCAAPFYQERSILLSADTELISTTQGELSDRCMFKKSMPTQYQLRRSDYTLFFEVDAQQLFILPEFNNQESNNQEPNNQESNDQAKLRVEIESKKGTEMPLTIEGEASEIDVLVYNDTRLIGREKIKLEKVNCIAVQK